MGKAQDPGLHSRVGNPQDVEVTGDLPTSMTTFVGRDQRPGVWPRCCCAEVSIGGDSGHEPFPAWHRGGAGIASATPAGRARLDDESPNLRAAIDDGCARAPDDALAMVGAMGLYWRVRGRLAEGVTAIEQRLRAAPPEPSPERALALAKLSLLTFWLGDFARTQSSAAAALDMGAAIGDTRSQALALSRPHPLAPAVTGSR
jgi:hypothetical protein